MNTSDAAIVENAFKLIGLNASDHPEFFRNWEEVRFRRSEIITEMSEPEPYFYVVTEGVQAVYLIDNQGEKRVLGFSFTGSFSGVYDAFLSGNPAQYYLEALSPSRLLRINKETYDSWFTQYPDFNYWGRIVHQELLIGRVNREVELVTMSAKQRYDEFMKRCPEPLRTIPQKYLASYLNMTAETFSRLRSLKS